MSLKLITEDQASSYLDGLYYGADKIGLYNSHLTSYEFGLLIVDGNLKVNGEIQYDRGIPILHVTGEINATNANHPLWKP